jgi:hypothetical protein
MQQLEVATLTSVFKPKTPHFIASLRKVTSVPPFPIASVANALANRSEVRLFECKPPSYEG